MPFPAILRAFQTITYTLAYLQGANELRKRKKHVFLAIDTMVVCGRMDYRKLRRGKWIE